MAKLLTFQASRWGLQISGIALIVLFASSAAGAFTFIRGRPIWRCPSSGSMGGTAVNCTNLKATGWDTSTLATWSAFPVTAPFSCEPGYVRMDAIDTNNGKTPKCIKQNCGPGCTALCTQPDATGATEYYCATH